MVYTYPTPTTGPDIWLWDEGKVPFQITKSGDVTDLSISNDGKIIVFTRQIAEKQLELWAIQDDGTNLRRLITAVEFSQIASIPDMEMEPWFRTAEWIGDSHTIVFHLLYRSEDQDVHNVYDIWRLNIDTGERLFLEKGEFDVSPDGQFIVIYNEQGINLYNADGRPYRLKVLPEYRVITEEGHYYFLSPSWAEDSKSFLIAQPETDNVYQPEPTFSLRRIWVDDQPVDNLGTFTGFAPSLYFSPDHQFIFYERDASKLPTELHLANLRTHEDVIYLKDDYVSFGGWSPNSQDFFFHVVYDIFIGNICINPQEARKLQYVNWVALPAWVDATTILISVRAEFWQVHYEHLGVPSGSDIFINAEKYRVVLIPNS